MTKFFVFSDLHYDEMSDGDRRIDELLYQILCMNGHDHGDDLTVLVEVYCPLDICRKRKP